MERADEQYLIEFFRCIPLTQWLVLSQVGATQCIVN